MTSPLTLASNTKRCSPGRYRIERIDGSAMAEALREMDRLHFGTSGRIDPTYGWWWVVWHDEQVVGFAGLNPSFQWQQCGYLCRAAVDDGHRGHGLQRRLIAVRLTHARRQGYRWVVTDTYDNPHSARNLIRTGFLPYHPANPWGFKHATYWIRRL